MKWLQRSGAGYALLGFPGYPASPPAVFRGNSHTFAGRDYTDRYRIKRKAQRWKKKFAALAPTERLAIMVALGEVE